MTPDTRTTENPEPRTEAGHPEATCQRCLGPNVWSWHAPSPLWNAVIRNPATGEDDWSILCPLCFAEIAELAGVVPVRRHTWHFVPEGIDVGSLWTDGDGRVWDAEKCLWIEAEAAQGAAPRAEGLEETLKRAAALIENSGRPAPKDYRDGWLDAIDAIAAEYARLAPQERRD